MTEILIPRDVPLGGLRAMNVRRTLPQRQRSLIGAWCFLDHYGPDRVDETGGMVVSPHPHIGLQTVSWLFGGSIEHRDSVGSHALVRPGELNLMTAGPRHLPLRGLHRRGHRAARRPALGRAAGGGTATPSRRSPTTRRHVVHGEGWDAQVFLGSMFGSTSPVETFTPLFGAEVIIDGGTTITPEPDPAFEYGVLVDFGTVHVNGVEVTPQPAGLRRSRRAARDPRRRPRPPAADRRPAVR